VRLQSLQLCHPRADALQAACQAIGLGGVSVQKGPAALSAELLTPKGRLTLTSHHTSP
jgi:hypothetical protein